MFDIKPAFTEKNYAPDPNYKPAELQAAEPSGALPFGVIGLGAATFGIDAAAATFGIDAAFELVHNAALFDSYFDEVRKTTNFDAGGFRQQEVFTNHVKKVKELTGKDVPNPVYQDVSSDLADPERQRKFNDAYLEHKREGYNTGYTEFAKQYAYKEFLDELEKIAQQHPDKRSEILPERDFYDSALGMRRDASQAKEKAWKESSQGIAAYTAAAAGMLAGGFTDPVNLALMLAQPQVGAARGVAGLATAAVKSGLYNAGAEVAVQPFKRADAALANMPMTYMDSVVDVGSAFGIGFGLDATVRGAFRGIQTYRSLTPILKDDHIIGWKRPGDAPDPATVAAPGTLIEPTPLDISPELTARAFGEGADAVAARAEIAKRMESAPDHVSMETVIKAESGDVAAQRKVAEVTGEIERPDVRARIDAEETANATLRNRPSELVDDDTHLTAVKQSLAYVADPQGNLPPARVLESGPSTGWLNDMRAKVEQLQAKVQDTLSDEDRKALMVVNTFDRANADPIAAARMLRDEPALMTRDLDFGETGLGQARSISTLSDEAFERVASGEYAPEIGALVADHVPEGFQIRALQDLTDRAPTSEAAARAMLADMLNSPDYRPPSLDAESPVTLRERQMDDPYGKEAQAQVAQLENDLAEELGRKAAPDPTPAEVITEAIKKADEVRAAIESVSGMLPEGVRVKTYTALSDVPDTVVADMLAANRQRFERASLAYQIADNAEARALARLELDEALALRGVEAFVDTADANTIWLASYAMNPRGRIAHEAVHILKAQGRIAPDELTALAQFARESGAFSPSRQASYAEAYAKRGTPERIAELLDEEAVSHLIEARANGKLDPVDVPPRVLTVLDRIAEFFDSIRNALVGKGFKSTAETTYAARKAQAAEIERLIGTIMDGEAAKRVATQAVMQAEDIKAMAVRSGTAPDMRAAIADPTLDAPAVRDPMSEQIDGAIDQGMAVARMAGIDVDPLTVRGMVDEAMGTDLPTQLAAREAAADALMQTPEYKAATAMDPSYSSHLREGYGSDADRAARTFDTPGPDGTLFAFAGERAKTADLEALSRAKKMTEEGKDRTEIWTSTGWFRGVDGKWRFEIDDSGAKFARDFWPGRSGDNAQLGNALSHPGLFGAYPSLAEIPAKAIGDSGGAFNPITKQMEIGGWYKGEANGNSIGMHEVQHAVQDAERFNQGGNVKYTKKYDGIENAKRDYLNTSKQNKERIEKIYSELEDLAGELYAGERSPPWTPWGKAKIATQKSRYDALNAEKDKLYGDLDTRHKNIMDAYGAEPTWEQGFDYYHRLAGETEARTVQKRMNLTPDKRRARPPWLDYDVPEADQIVRFGQGQQNSETLFAMRDADTGQSMRRDLDALGYYSAALEAARGLKQAKGTPEQMLAQLRSAGVKQAEIDATNLAQFLDGKKSVTRDEIASYLETNRVGVKEQTYERSVDQYGDQLPGTPEPKWQANSLDKNNPTYRETVIHLAKDENKISSAEANLAQIDEDIYTKGKPILVAKLGRKAEALSPTNVRDMLPDLKGSNPAVADLLNRRAQALSDLTDAKHQTQFQSGHFSEPNIIGHMMTSMTKHEGRPVYTIDQIQSDWGQKLRDGGVRDEAKIADLRAKRDDVKAKYESAVEAEKNTDLEVRIQDANARYAEAAARAAGKDDAYGAGYQGSELQRIADETAQMMSARKSNEFNLELRRLDAELRTIEASAPGHPLVNTTDQWTTTTLRRAIRQAAEADAEYIAIPSGDTVLSYNPGDTHGMHSFYGRTTERQALNISDNLEPLPSTTSRAPVEGIVPKNLRKLLQKLDKDSPAPQRIETLDTPTSGAKGKGFTLFPLTEKVKASVREEGQALFAMRDERGREKLGAAERAATLKDDLAKVDAQFQASGGDERLKLQAKRAVLLNAQKQEKRLDEIEQYRSFAGTFDSRKVADPARAFLLQHEAYGSISDTPFMDAKHLKEVIEKDAMSRIAGVAFYFKKGAITGDMRRRYMRTSIDNMMKEAAGENTGDALAKKLAQEWLSTAEYLRQRLNAAGGDIGKLEGWIAPQHHDAEMLMQVGQRKWVDYLMGKGVLDRERMLDLATGKPFEDAALRDVLGDIWMTITTSGKNNLDPDNPVMGKGAMYKRHMDHRVLHFKDAESWLKYQREMGSGDVVAAMYGHISRMARDIAAMEMFGPNPVQTRERIKATLRKQAAEYRPNSIAMAELGDVMREAWNKLQASDQGANFSGAVRDAYNSVRAANRKLPDMAETLADLAKSLDELRLLSQAGQVVDDAAFAKMEANLAVLEKVFTQLDQDPTSGSLAMKGRALMNDLRNEAETPSVLAKKKNPQSYTDKMLTRADEVWDAFMGTSNVPADYVIAQRAAATRNWISSSALVYTPFASLSDFSTQLGARRFIGMPVTSQLSSYFKAFKNSSKEEMIRAGLGHEVAMTAFQEQAMSVNRFNAHQVSGFIADRSHTFSFLSPMTAAQKTGFSHDFMTWMPTLQKLPYNELPPEVQRMFKRHGVSILDWDLRLRKVEPEMLGGGVPALTRNAIQDQFGIDLADKYVMMLLRERAFSTIESGFRARTLITSNSKAGTLLGELARSGGMFKAFPTMYTMLIIGRQYSEIMNGRYGNFAAYTTAATIGGMLLAAVAIQTKHILQGRDPEDMRKPSFFVRSFMQAGGGGIFGDFINSATDRNQNSVGETLLGPMFGMAQKGLNLTLGNAGQYGRDEKSNAGREALKIVRGMTPGAFVPWYLRMAYNRMILDEMQKVVDPDAHKAFQSQRRNTKKLTGNDYFWGPGETYPNRGPRIGASVGAQ